MYTNLFDLPVGQTAQIQSLQADGPIRRRLLDIGMVDGTYTTCLYAAPSGDPKAYWVRGAVIAIRKEDATRILARPMPRFEKKEVPVWV